MRSLALILIKFLLITFIFSGQNYAFAQQIKVHGKVIDQKTSKPLPYVNVFVLGEPSGTMTNLRGEFSFNIGKFTEEDTLCISMLGYIPYKSVLSKLNFNSELSIKLSPTVYNMTEVQIRPGATDAYNIIKRAIDSLKSKTYHKPFVSEGFYREYIKENNNYARAIEAAVSVYNDGKENIGDKFFSTKINGVRYSEDYLSKLAKAGSFNQLSLFLTNNFDYKWFFAPVEDTKYWVDSMVMLDKTLVYVITGVPEKTSNKTYRKIVTDIDFETGEISRHKIKYSALVKRNTDLYYTYTFYIKSDDYSILKMSYRDTLYKPILSEYIKQNGLYISYNSTNKYVEFFEYNNNLFPRYIKAECDIGYYKKKDSVFFISVSKYSDMMVNQVNTGKVSDFLPEKQPGLFADIYTQGYEYNPEFWANYNYIPDDEMRNEVTRSVNLIKTEYLAANANTLKNAKMNADSANNEPVLVEGLVFRIQVMALKEKISIKNPAFKGLKNLVVYFHDGMYKYTWAETPYMSEAIDMLKQIQSKGFPGAFIVPFYKNARITMDEVVTIINSTP